MDPQPVPGLRKLEQIMAAYGVAAAMYKHEADSSPAKPWLAGMVASGQWMLGYQDIAPMAGQPLTPTRRTVSDQMLAAGERDFPGGGRGLSDPAQMFARGTYRMLAYGLGLSDELPVRLSREVALAMIQQQAA